MLKWTVLPEQRSRRREPSLTKRRKLSFHDSQNYLVNDSSSWIIKTSKKTAKFDCLEKKKSGESEGESKSLFYMSLDHLPLAIIKQVERMTQRPETRSNTTSNESEPSDLSSEMVPSGHHIKKRTRIKEAIHRPLKVANRSGIIGSTQRYSDSDSDSDSFSSKGSGIRMHDQWKPTAQDPRPSGNPIKVQKPILKRIPPNSRPMDVKGIKMSSRDTHKIQFIKSTNHDNRNKHDTTDPHFLTTPAANNQKLSLKRRELRKLEQLRSESEKLTRFLRKYYNDCLPQLPPEDEVEYYPEQKTMSVFLNQLTNSILLWDKGLENKSTDSTSSRTTDFETLVTHLPPIPESPEGSNLSLWDVPRMEHELMKSDADISFHLPPPHTSQNKNEVDVKSTPKRRRELGRKKVIGAKKKRTPVSTKGRGEVLLSRYRNGTDVTVHVVEARNLQPFLHSTPRTPSKSQSNTWQLSFKVSLLGAEGEVEEKVVGSSYIKVTRGQDRIQINEKFSFNSHNVKLSERKSEGKVFLSFWRRWDEESSKKASVLIGWTRTQLEEDQEIWVELRNDKMQRHRHIPRMLETFLPMEVKSNSNDMLHNSLPTIDSGVEDCGSDQFQSGSNECGPHNSTTPLQILLILQKHAGETGFGFSVIWSTPPQIGRITPGMAAQRRGLQRGDIICRVNHEDIAHLDRDTIIQKMKCYGTTVELEVMREYEEDKFIPGHRHCSCVMTRSGDPGSNLGQATSILPLPTASVLKPPRPPPSWKIQFKSSVGQGTLV